MKVSKQSVRYTFSMTMVTRETYLYATNTPSSFAIITTNTKFYNKYIVL